MYFGIIPLTVEKVKTRRDMAISYNNLWKILIDKGMSKTDLRIATGLSCGTLARLSKRLPIETTTIEKICHCLKCDVGDIMQYLSEEKNDNEEEQHKF